MKNKVTNNLSLKLLALVVAFVIWVFVVNVDDPVKPVLFRDIKIQTLNEDSVTEIDKVFDIVSDETVTIKVKERRSVLSSLSRDDFTVTADLENLNDMGTVPLSVTCRNPSVTWDEVEIIPSSLKVQLQQRKQAEFAVNISISGQPERGYEVGTTEILQGKTIQIAGSESLVNRIGQVIASINVTGIRNNQRLNAGIRILDKYGDPFTEAQMGRLQLKDGTGVLLADNSVIVDVTLWETLNDIPVEVETEGEPAKGYRVADVNTVPVTINVVGTKEALAALNGKIKLDTKIDVENATESITQIIDMNETLDEIDGLRLVQDAEPAITVSVQIEKTGDYSLKLPLSNLEVQNKPEKLSLTFSPADELSIIAHTDNLELEPIKRSDIKASIDLGVCNKPGIYDIPVDIELPEGYALVSDVYLVVTAEEQKKQTTEDYGLQED